MTAANTPSREEMGKRAVAHITRWGGSHSAGLMMLAFAEAEIARLAAKPADVKEVTDAMIEAYAKAVGETLLIKNLFLWHEIRKGLIGALSTKGHKP